MSYLQKQTSQKIPRRGREGRRLGKYSSLLLFSWYLAKMLQYMTASRTFLFSAVKLLYDGHFCGLPSHNLQSGVGGQFCSHYRGKTPIHKEGEVWGAHIGTFVPQTQIKAELSSPVLLTGTRLSFKSRWRNTLLKTIFKFTQFYKLTYLEKWNNPLTENLVVALPFFCTQCHDSIDGIIQFLFTALSDIFQNIQCSDI